MMVQNSCENCSIHTEFVKNLKKKRTLQDLKNVKSFYLQKEAENYFLKKTTQRLRNLQNHVNMKRFQLKLKESGITVTEFYQQKE